MAERRVTVWVQRFKDRESLMLQWLDPETGRRKSKSAGTADPKEAEQRRADHEYELNHGVYQEASKMWWDRFRDLFENEFLSARRPNTRTAYGFTLDAFERICKPRAIAGVTERATSAFAAGLRQAGQKSSTIKLRLQHLRTVLKWAAEQKIIPAAPKCPSIKVPKKRPKPVPAEVFAKLLAEAGDDRQMRAYLLTGWLAGLRTTEAWSLEWGETDAAPWVDAGRRMIVLPAEIVKGDEDQTVPLDPELLAVLEALPRHGRRVFRFIDKNGNEASALSVGRRVKALAKRAGVPLTFRSLRRGFACEHAAHVPAQVLQALLRHKNIATTMAYYANTEGAAADAVRERNRRRNSATDEGGKTPDSSEE